MTGFVGIHYRSSVRMITEVSVTWGLVNGLVGVKLRTLCVTDMGLCLDSLKIHLCKNPSALAFHGSCAAGWSQCWQSSEGVQPNPTTADF